MNYSSRLHPSFRGNRGFTLIELLTVIAIIGILAAILIPVVGRVRSSAQTSACASNLRQMGVAFNLYAEANRGFLPPAQTTGETFPLSFWQAKIQPYLERRNTGAGLMNRMMVYEGVFRCPGKMNWDIETAASTDQTRISYGMNTFGEGNTTKATRLSSIQNPTITALVSDINTNPGGITIRTAAYLYDVPNRALWHNNKDNVLFVDGHVEQLPVDSLNYWLVKSKDDQRL